MLGKFAATVVAAAGAGATGLAVYGRNVTASPGGAAAGTLLRKMLDADPGLADSVGAVTIVVPVLVAAHDLAGASRTCRVARLADGLTLPRRGSRAAAAENIERAVLVGETDTEVLMSWKEDRLRGLESFRAVPQRGGGTLLELASASGFNTSRHWGDGTLWWLHAPVRDLVARAMLQSAADELLARR